MKQIFTFWTGIISGVIISVLVAFILNSTLTLSPTYSRVVDINEPNTHYEFSSGNESYIENYEITYEIKTPFYSFDFNSKQEIKKPEGYFLINLSENNECVQVEDKGDKLLLIAKVDQFKIPKCFVSFNYFKKWLKEDLVKIYKGGWRKDKDDKGFYEEEGISIHNKFDFKIKNYIFQSQQNESSKIKKRISECNRIVTMMDGKDIEHKTNWFFDKAADNPTIAIRFDIEPRQTKELILRCYH